MAAPTPEEIAAGVPAQVNVVARVAAPGGGTYLLGSDGGVFAINGAKYAGGVNALQGDTLAGKHQFAANSIQATGPGAYAITDTAGHTYNFGAPTGNPLAQDPSFLAFLRTSGLGVDQAVNEYTNAVNRAAMVRDAALKELDLNNPLSVASHNRQDLAQQYEGRGYSGSGQQALGITQYDADNANKQAGVNQDYTNAVQDAGDTEGQTIGKIATAGIEQGLDTGNSQGWNQFWQGEAQKFPGQSDTILKNIGSNSNPSGS